MKVNNIEHGSTDSEGCHCLTLIDPCKPHIPWSYLGALLQVLLDWVVLERGRRGWRGHRRL